jgi:sensor c-di-GMP phosphodiesterase-like protein
MSRAPESSAASASIDNEFFMREDTEWLHPMLLLAGALFTVAFGIAAGWYGGAWLQTLQAGTELQRSSERVHARLDEIISETIGVFESLDGLPLRHCSDEMLLEMRTHLFEARFLKDIGGLQDRALVCSTALGRLDQPLRSGLPDLELSGLVGLRLDRSVLASTRLRTMVIERKNFNALVDPRHVSDLVTSLGNTEIFLRAASDADHTWQAFEATGQERLPLLNRSRHPGLGNTHCDDDTGLCILLHHLPDGSAVGQRETRLVISTLGGGLGLAFFLGALSLNRQRNTPEQALRRAIRHGDIKAVFQPIISLPDHELFGFEALARWNDNNKRTIPPEQFIALAENSGLINQISALMIRLIGEELGDWLAESEHRHIAINIAPSELSDPGLLRNLQKHLLNRGVKPGQIVLEITERTMLESEAAGRQIEALTRHGFAVYADDFGVGYCGLGYLNELDMDGIKISQSFTAAVATDSPKATLVPRIIEMAHELGLRVIIEGVETERQCQTLSELGPVMAQGWYFAREMPADEVISRFS